MKYLIPFWYWERPLGEAGMQGDLGDVFTAMIVIGGIVSGLIILGTFIFWEMPPWFLVRIFALAMLAWIVPNYYISYKYWKYDNDKI